MNAVPQMADHSLIIPETERVPSVRGPAYSPTLRDIVAIGFRRRRLIALSFFGIMMGAGMAAFFLGNKYRAEMKILVNGRARVDALTNAENKGEMASPVTRQSATRLLYTATYRGAGWKAGW